MAKQVVQLSDHMRMTIAADHDGNPGGNLWHLRVEREGGLAEGYDHDWVSSRTPQMYTDATALYHAARTIFVESCLHQNKTAWKGFHRGLKKVGV